MLPNTPLTSAIAEAPNTAVDARSARSQRWAAAAGLTGDSSSDPEASETLIAAKLGGTVAQLRHALDHAEADLSIPTVLDDWYRTQPTDAERADWERWSAAYRTSPFAVLVARPAIATARRLAALHQEAAARGLNPHDAIFDQVIGGAIQYADLLAGRTAVLELNIRRLDDRLPGDTPAERNAAYLADLRDGDAALELLRAYPPVANDIVQLFESIVRRAERHFHRLFADLADLRQDFGIAAEQLSGYQAAAGDVHHDDAVASFTFADHHSVILKPRSLRAEQCYQGIVTWVGERLGRPISATWGVIDRGDYGWVEVLERRDCASVDEAARYFENFGAILAVLHLIGGSDIHRDNVIAVGDLVAVVDLETLLTPIAHNGDEFADHIERAVQDSVLRTLLLPDRGDGTAFDDAAAAANQDATASVPTVVGGDSDQARIERIDVPIMATDNAVRVDGQRVNPVDHVARIAEGFTTTYRALADVADEFADIEPLSELRNLPQRFVARDTSSYYGLLSEAWHPHNSNTELDREIWFSQLWQATDANPRVADLVPHELADLLRGEIPAFTCLPDSTDLLASGTIDRPGPVISPGFFAESGWDAFERRLRFLGDHDLERQLQLVVGSFLSAVGDTTDTPPIRMPTDVAVPTERSSTSELAIELATAQAHRLAANAWTTPGDVRGAGWTGFADTPSGTRIELVGADLYAGTGGIALALDAINRHTGDHAELLADTVNTFAATIEQAGGDLHEIGGHTGWGGLVWAAHRLADRHHLTGDVGSWLDTANELVDGDHHFDVLSGAAGLGLAALAGHQHADGTALAITCAQHLQAHAHQHEDTWSWPISIDTAPEPVALTGFAHGTSGIATFFARLAAQTADPQWSAAADRALRFEANLYSAEHRNWPDLRYPDREPAYVTAWCHGAAGIALGRLECLSAIENGAPTSGRFDVEPLTTDLRNATRSTLGVELPGDGLCHGNLGNLAIMRRAAAALGDEELDHELQHQTASTLQRIADDGPNGNQPFGLIEPGLFTGLAGFVLALLDLGGVAVADAYSLGV